MSVKKELMKAVTDASMKLRPLMVSQFVKPIKEMHRGVFPPGYIQVMFILEKQEEPISMTDLAMATCISKPNLTTVIDRLYADGLADRSPDKNDRRVINVFLTDKGIEFLDIHRQSIKNYIDKKLSVLEEEDIQRLVSALQDMTDIFEKMKKSE